MDKQNLVIIGAGQAGIQTAITLRKLGYQENIFCINEEKYLPYYRPPLSKIFLKGDLKQDKLLIRPEEFYQQQKIELVFDKVAEIDTKQKNVIIKNNKKIKFSKLVIATGSSSAQIKLIKTNDENILALRKLKDAQILKQKIQNNEKIVIVGAGFIGLEVASIARKLDKQVIIIEAQDRIMKRSVSAEISQYFYQMHRKNNVEIITNAIIKKIYQDAKQINIELYDKIITTNLLLIAVGARPNIQIAQNAGIKTQKAIIVDQYCQTSEENIFAAGDCAQQFNRFAKDFSVLESIQNATDQARTIAAKIVGKPKKHDFVPWFWSDQYEQRLQIAGIKRNITQNITYLNKQDKQKKTFSIFGYQGQSLTIVESVNQSAQHMWARKNIQNANTIQTQNMQINQ